MKKLPLQNSSFRYLENSFREWLDMQGYGKSTVYTLPNQVRELLHYLEGIEINHIKALTPHHMETYYAQLKSRANERRGGGLSAAHLNKHIHALRLFTRYLRKVGRLDIPEANLKSEEATRKMVYLSEKEILDLFAVTYRPVENPPNAPEDVITAMQARDRAMLAVYYGCGLRRNEGVYLDVGDIYFDRSMLHVRKGKNYQERMVPVSRTSLKYLSDYVYDHRPQLNGKATHDALFVTYTSANRMQGQSLLLRLKRLQQLTGDPDLMGKEIGLHTLRHSIATHFLQSGMPLESIRRFLGHSSLESTQIYTHLTGNPQIKPQPFYHLKQYSPLQLSEDD